MKKLLLLRFEVTRTLVILNFNFVLYFIYNLMTKLKTNSIACLDNIFLYEIISSVAADTGC
jgi:hypothetical protein